MADLLSVGTGIAGIISLAIQITQVVVQFGLNWKDAPHDVMTFKAELQTLITTLSETQNNLLLNSDFAEAFQHRSSVLLSELGPNAPSTTEAKMMLEICEKELKSLLQELVKRAKGHRIGWERMKGAFLAKRTRESVENLHRWCQALNNLISIDTAALGADTYTEVKEARNEQQKWHESEISQKILTWITPFDYGPEQSDILARREPGTGEWLLLSDEFQGWCNGQTRTLFYQGMPGAGKTIMTSVVVDYLNTKYRDATDIGIAYLYCNFRRQDEQKPADLLASLLKQLLRGLLNMPESVTRLYEHHKGRGTRPSFDEISQELRTVANSYSKCFFIVDALDESQEGGRRKLLSELFDLQTRASTSLFATSRFIPEIEEEFAGKCASLEIHARDEDVRRYLDGHMTRLPSFVQRNASLQEEIKTEIVKAVQGMFLLAQLHLDSLIGSKSAKSLKTALRGLPKGSKAYDHAYNEAMDRILGQIANSRDLAKQVLSWITCAKRPLTTLELRHALAVEVDGTELDEDNLPETDDMVSVCAGLVTVDEESNIIRLVHYTTQQFFERTWKEWFPNAQDDIAMVCVTYLSFDVFELGFCQSDKEFEDRLVAYPLYEYAARYWGYHCREDSDIQDTIPKFLASEAKRSYCSQVLMVSTAYRFREYSQEVPQQMTAVHLTAWFGLSKMTETLLKDGYDSDNKDSDCRTPLSYAAENGHKGVVKLLVERDKVEADSKDQFGRTPLSYAAEYGHEWVTKLLVERDNVDADSKDHHGRTPLSYAAWKGHKGVVKLLLEHDDVEADLKDQDGQTPLSYAAWSGYERVVKLLLQRDDVEADSKDQYGNTPLSYAADSGNEEVMQMLINAGANVNVQCEHGDALYKASVGGHEKVVQMLITAGADVARIGGNALRAASARGYENVVQILINTGADVNAQVERRDTALYTASREGHEKVVQMLIDAGADVNLHKGNTYASALYAASERGYEKVVQMLIDAGANVNTEDEGYNNTLNVASRNGHVKVVQMLIDAGADVNAYGVHGTSLYEAAERGYDKVVQILINAGANVNAQGGCYGNALDAASREGHEKVVQILIDAGADVNVGGMFSSALYLASERGHEKVVQILINAGPNVNAPGGYYGNALDAASIFGHEKVVQILIDAGADFDVGGIFSSTLYLASERGHEKVVQILINAGADVNAQGGYYANALDAASRFGYKKVMQMLINAGADVKVLGGINVDELLAALE